MSPNLDIDPALLGRVQDAIDDIRSGKMVILVDDEDRENEGDLVFAAERVTADMVNFMAIHGRGLICLTMTEEQVERLELPMMALPKWRGGPPLGTAFTLSIEARHGVTTGISAADRARTIQAAVSPDARPEDIVTPGHVFPLKARRGGVLVRTGQTEGSVDLARLAGCNPSGVICEIMKEDGTMARMPDLEVFGKAHGLRIITVADLIRYRLQTEQLVRRVYERPVVLDHTGTEWKAIVYSSTIDSSEFLALVHVDPSSQEAPLVRMHRGAVIADTFTSTREEGGANLREAIEIIEKEEAGVVVYLPPAGDLKGELENFRDASEKSSVDATRDAKKLEPPHRGALRGFGQGAQVLRELGLHQIRLLSNSRRKIAGIQGYGLEVVDTIALGPKFRAGKS